MDKQVIYIPTPVSQKPEKEGYYVVVKDGQDRLRSDCYWTGEDWRFYKNLPQVVTGLSQWLRPTTLPQELAAKDKEIAEIKAFSKQAIELLTDNHKLEIEKRDKQIAELRATTPHSPIVAQSPFDNQ